MEKYSNRALPRTNSHERFAKEWKSNKFWEGICEIKTQNQSILSNVNYAV